MKDFLIKYGVLILASIGVVQYWIIAIYNKWLRKGSINIYKSGTIILGYDYFSGANITLSGTIRSFNKEIFINRIYLKVIRLEDKAEHNFDWQAFKAFNLFILDNSIPKIELPTGFIVTQKVPYRFNILFNDRELIEKLKSEYKKYIDEWNKYYNELKIIENKFQAVKVRVQKQFELIEKFRKCVTRTEVYSKLNDLFYWKDGEYSIDFFIQTSKPDKVYKEQYKFVITEEESKNLKLNVISILELPIANYLNNKPPFFNYPQIEYKE